MDDLQIKQKGTVLIIAFIIMGVLILLGVYFLSFTLTESRITKSQTVGTQTYYLAEAGINEVIWKLKYDDVWSTCFVTSSVEFACDCANWAASFSSSTDSLIPNSTITVTIINSECARGELTATSTIALPGGKTAQRVVKTNVFKAIGSLTAESVFFAGSDTEESLLEDVSVYIYDGNIAARGDLRIDDSALKVYDDPDPEIQTGLILVGHEIDIDSWSEQRLTASSSCSASTCGEFCPTDDYCPFGGGGCPCTKLPPFPTVDFNSTSSSSYYQKAKAAQENGQCEVEGRDEDQNILFTISTCIFNYYEFEDLLEQVPKGSWWGDGGTLILKHKANGIATSTYYIEGGGFELKEKRNLEVNGVLVTEGTVSIGTNFFQDCWSVLTIFHPTSTPSGLLTTGRMEFGPCASYPDETVIIEGLIYAIKELNIEDIMGEYKVTGGVITNKFRIEAKNYELYLDDDIIKEGIWGGPQPPGETKPPFSPIVTIEHWEESY